MQSDSIYVLNIENLLGFQKVKEDSSFVQFSQEGRIIAFTHKGAIYHA